jgi:hypothetical protein
VAVRGPGPRAAQRPGFAAYGGANAFEPPLGKPLAGKKKASHGVGGGVVSKKPDMAVSMKRMLRRK